jgi:lipocalin
MGGGSREGEIHRVFIDRQLKVSFFGPFYGAYNVIMLDKAYKRDQYVSEAKRIGYKTEDLIWVEQSR